MGTFGHQKGQPAANDGGNYPAEILSRGEVQAVIGQCSKRAPTGVRNRALIVLLYRSGLRINEALALKPSDLDMGERSIRVLDPKTGKPQTRGWHPDADDALCRWLDTRKALGIGNHGTKLFCTLDGGPVSDRYVRNLLHRIAPRAGVDKRVVPHTFRHTFAKELEDAGAPVTTISKLLGHHSIATTAHYLDHLTNREAVKALQSIALPSLAPEGAR